MDDKRKKWLKFGVGIMLGGVAGFAYYSFVGFESGGCPITSNPWISTAYGGVFGAVIGWS